MQISVQGPNGLVQSKRADTDTSKTVSSLMEIHESLLRNYLDTVMGYTKWNHFIVAANMYPGADKVNMAKVIQALDKLGLVDSDV